MSATRQSAAPAWQQEDLERQEEAQRKAGAALWKHLLSCYSLGKLTAADLCIACSHCQHAAVRGAEFSKFAQPPGLASGSYQRHLDTVLPPLEHVYRFVVPGNVRKQSVRSEKTITAKAFWESIPQEFEDDPSRVGVSPATPMPPSYNTDELVVRCRAAGQPLPLPLTLYIDAVRVTSALGGRTESLIGFWLYAGTSLRRHLLLGLRKTLLCQCGCRGWCTLYVVFAYIAYGLRMLRSGERSALRHDGSPADAEALQLRVADRFLACRAILHQLKVDLAELAPTLGIQPWNSH